MLRRERFLRSMISFQEQQLSLLLSSHEQSMRSPFAVQFNQCWHATAAN